MAGSIPFIAAQLYEPWSVLQSINGDKTYETQSHTLCQSSYCYGLDENYSILSHRHSARKE